MLKSLNQKSRQKCLQSQVRGVTTRQLKYGNTIDQRHTMKVLDIQAKLRGSLGVVRLNREHRSNILTPNFIPQLKRAVETMYIDHTIELIYLTTYNGQQFCNGTDFRTLMHWKANNEHGKAVDYLGKVFDLQATFAKINKPIMAIAPGSSLNSGAGLLSACGLPYITESSLMAFNEVQFGFVPHAGSCYYMSRLPGEFGTFLILTGWPMTGQDAIELGLADGHVDNIKEHEYHMADNIYNLDSTGLLSALQYRNGDGIGIGEKKPVSDHALEYSERLNDTHSNYEWELRRRTLDTIHEEQFIDPKLRKPDIVAEADIAYERILRGHSEATHGLGGFNFYEHGGKSFNIFQDIYEHCNRDGRNNFSFDAVKTLMQHRQMIDRCFWPSSIEEIMKNLQRENTPFAQEILKQMRKNSMLSMKIALKMMRRARNMAYGEVLKMELNASLNKLNDSDFDIGVQKVLMKPNRPKANPGFQKEVSDD